MPLQSSGILDSLAVLDLIAFLEKQFRIQLSASETGVEGFDRIQDIAILVDGKEPG
jgi:acyl carrier protein